MNYIQRSVRWKIILVVSGLIIVIISIFYTNFLAQKLAEGEKNKVQIFAMSFESLNRAPLDADVALEQQLIEKIMHTGIPIILVDGMGRVQEGYNYGDKNDDIEFLQKQLEEIKKNGYPPVRASGYASYIYYDNSYAYTLLTYFPIVQILLLACFLLISFLVFSGIRKSEQNQVWAGLAKETAHQLGTPISSLIAWIELFKARNEDNDASIELIDEMQKDVNRLDLISQRFSRIGSKPELERTNIVDLLCESAEYMKKRAPRKVSFDFTQAEDSPPIYVMANASLFEWVIENLIRNALDALDGKGEISGQIAIKNNKAYINISDTGKGIPSDKRKAVFKPGYSTKKRGWGLGLSLSKRIVNNYHNGKIYVKDSKAGKGTTFTIQLPLVPQD